MEEENYAKENNNLFIVIMFEHCNGNTMYGGGNERQETSG